ncbi:hypothetical protein [Sinorhizobium medicae]|uniref:hypothetical protein n=1 Tax=Sinorhizobium medicae TaxID=110321 RepID=UPI001F413E06|nr:hypothetical protein [Sinorhizobium medicae]
MQEAVDKPLQEVTLAFLGDGRSPIAPSLATGAAKLGMDFRIIRRLVSGQLLHLLPT